MTNTDVALNYLIKHKLVPLPCMGEGDSKGKIPLIKWEKIHELPLPDQVREWFKKYPNANIGFKTGKVSKILVLDNDGVEVIQPLPLTPTVTSQLGHFHSYFQNPDFYVPPSASKIGEHLDIRCDQAFIVAPPSKHFNKETGHEDGEYTWIDGMSPDDIPFAPCPEWLIAEIKKTLSSTHGFDWSTALNVGIGARDETLKSAAASLVAKGFEYETALAILRGINSTYEKALDDKLVVNKLETAIEFINSQKDKSSNQSSNGGSKKEKEEKLMYTADFDGLVDLVEDNGQIKFLTFDGRVSSQVEIDGRIFLPPPSVNWLLPNAAAVLKEFSKHSDNSDDTDGLQECGYCQKDLYPSLISYFKQFSELPTEYHYHYLAWMAFHSHLIEKFNYSPILFFVATKDRGKTPTLKALAFISRRGIFTETFREANLIRWSGDYKASLFFDVKNFPKKVELNNCEDLIYGRAERGVNSSRVLSPEKGPFRDMRTFSTFGVTGATSNYMVDDITEARCIVFNMPFSSKVFNIEALPELGLPFRGKLIACRMAHFHTPFLEVKKEQPGKLENYLRGYHQMIKTGFPLYEKYFLEFKMIVSEQKQEEAENSFEARIIKLVDGLNAYVEEGSLCLTYEDICKAYNEGKEKEISERSIAHILKGLGFKTKRNSAGTKRGIFYDEEFIKYLKISYGLEVPPPQSQSETSDSADEK